MPSCASRTSRDSFGPEDCHELSLRFDREVLVARAVVAGGARHLLDDTGREAIEEEGFVDPVLLPQLRDA